MNISGLGPGSERSHKGPTAARNLLTQLTYGFDAPPTPSTFESLSRAVARGEVLALGRGSMPSSRGEQRSNAFLRRTTANGGLEMTVRTHRVPHERELSLVIDVGGAPLPRSSTGLASASRLRVGHESHLSREADVDTFARRRNLLFAAQVLPLGIALELQADADTASNLFRHYVALGGDRERDRACWSWRRQPLPDHVVVATSGSEMTLWIDTHAGIAVQSREERERLCYEAAIDMRADLAPHGVNSYPSMQRLLFLPQSYAKDLTQLAHREAGTHEKSLRSERRRSPLGVLVADNLAQLRGVDDHVRRFYGLC